MSESYSKCYVFLCKKPQIIFQSGHTIFHYHQQCMRVPFLHPYQLFYSQPFKILAILGMEWHFIVLICIFLMMLIRTFSCSHLPSLVKYMFTSFVYHFNYIVFLLSFGNSLCVLDMSPLSDLCFANIFPSLQLGFWSSNVFE